MSWWVKLWDFKMHYHMDANVPMLPVIVSGSLLGTVLLGSNPSAMKPVPPGQIELFPAIQLFHQSMRL